MARRLLPSLKKRARMEAEEGIPDYDKKMPPGWHPGPYPEILMKTPKRQTKLERVSKNGDLRVKYALKRLTRDELQHLQDAWIALFHHFRLDPYDPASLISLAYWLMKTHIPAFGTPTLEGYVGRGRRPRLGPNHQLAVYQRVTRFMGETGHSISKACRILTDARQGEYKDKTPETLRATFYLGKRLAAALSKQPKMKVT